MMGIKKDKLVAGLDPGSEKCGLAIVDGAGRCLYHYIVATDQLEQELVELQQRQPFDLLVMGNGTTSRRAEARVRQALPYTDVVVVDEYRTTDAARTAYWEINPPRGWRRLMPRGMLVPPEPVDDLAAMILAQRYVKGRGSDKGLEDGGAEG